jgi:UDP-N-acetylmuramoylalanine--D-glutamate ligase
VLVMGLGLLGGGVASARYAVAQGAAEVTVTDLRSKEMLAPSVATTVHRTRLWLL